MGKRILYINESLCTGSTGRIVEHLGLAAQQAGYECVVAHGARYVQPSQLPHVGFSSKIEEYAHGALSLLLNAHGLGSRLATRRLIAWIEQYQPSLIHLHNIHGYYLHYPTLFAYLKSRSIPVVWTLHDCWAMTGRCAYFTAHQCEQWQRGCSHCPSYADYPRSIVPCGVARNYRRKKEAFSHVNQLTLVPVSQWLEGVARRSFLNPYPLQTIYNGIDTTLFRPTPSDWRVRWQAEDKIVLLGVASQWTATKGWEDWLQLAQRLDERYQLVLVGVSEAQRKVLPAHCIGLPRTEDLTLLAQLYTAADIYINLAHQEAFGLTLVEAMACGTPCISYRTTAIPELITPAVGTCVPDGDISGVMAAIEQYGAQGKKEKGKACQAHVRALFDEQTSIKRYLDLYSHLIS